MGGLSGGVVPYRVAMDGGGSVLVHRDEHWLVRDRISIPLDDLRSIASDCISLDLTLCCTSICAHLLVSPSELALTSSPSPFIPGA